VASSLSVPNQQFRFRLNGNRKHHFAGKTFLGGDMLEGKGALTYRRRQETKEENKEDGKDNFIKDLRFFSSFLSKSSIIMSNQMEFFNSPAFHSKRKRK